MGRDLPPFFFVSKLSPYFISLRFDTWYQAYWSMNSCLVVVNLCFEGSMPLIAIYQYIHNAHKHTHTHTQEPFSESIQDQSYFKRRAMFNGGHSLTDVKNPFRINVEDPEKEKEKECQWILPPGGKLTVPNSAWANPPISRSWMVEWFWLGWEDENASEKVWKMHRVHQVHCYVFKF